MAVQQSQKPQQDKKYLLSCVPTEATRVQVVDEFGKTKFKKPDEVADSDYIVTNNDGDPIVMIGAPGRKPKVTLAPTNAAVAEVIRQKKRSLEEDDLLGTVSGNPEAPSVLDHVMRGLAEEAASLRFERDEAERGGKETSQISMRRVSALKAVGDSWLKRREQLNSIGVDMESFAFKRLFKYIADTFRVALEESGVRPEMIETIFASFSKKLTDEWQHEAIKRMTES